MSLPSTAAYGCCLCRFLPHVARALQGWKDHHYEPPMTSVQFAEQLEGKKVPWYYKNYTMNLCEHTG
jgi:hypothetical protein